MKRKRVNVEEESNAFFAALVAHSEKHTNIERDRSQSDDGSPSPDTRDDRHDAHDESEPEDARDQDVAERAREALFKDLERRRQERMQALDDQLSSLDADAANDHDTWGASDEEPDEEQAEFMRRTASHIASSPNPTQLEMRILTNYGSDPRFAFLKGRWARSWRAIQARNRMQKENEEKVSRGNKNENGISLGGGLNGLDAYGSDEE